ncbi:MAG: glycosyltransferase [Parvularculaceae bacterium]
MVQGGMVQGAHPKFAISVPVGAYHPLLKSCLASLARQRADVAVAFLDASGDPRVAQLADQYAGLFAYRRHGPDKGQSDAILEGWRNVPGDVLGWLNADDFLYPGALDLVAEKFAADAGVDIVFGHSAICDATGAMTGYHSAVRADAEQLRVGGSISQPSCLFKRDAYERAGGLDIDRHFTMDWDLWLRLLQSGARFEFLDRPLSVVFWGDGTKTASFNSRRREELRSLIERFTPADQRARVFRGFATQATLDLYCPPALRKFLQRHLGRNRTEIFGMTSSGAIDKQASIHWFHFRPKPTKAISVEFDAPCEVEIAADREIATAEPAGAAYRVAFAAPVGPGEVVELIIRPHADVRFVKADWI